MIIDFHAHTFPDKIAQKTIDFLAAKANIPPFSDGSVAGLIKRIENAKIDLAVNLPVLTNPAQFESVNRFALSINANYAESGGKIVSFAGIHPYCEDVRGKMKWIKEQGFLGVKIHPDYQETFIDDEGYIKILQCAKEFDLIVTAHTGVDYGYPDFPVRCAPERAKRVIQRVGHSKFVLAHLGANEMTDEVYDILAGEDVYFDTAYILRFIGKEKFFKIVEKHGEDRILFATDSPWSDIAGDVEILKSFGLGKETEEKIFSGNARKLLGI